MNTQPISNFKHDSTRLSAVLLLILQEGVARFGRKCLTTILEIQ